MKRMIDYIKNLFGADVRLRKWCLDKAIFTAGQPSEQAYKVADAFYDWVKARANKTNSGSECKHDDEESTLRMRIFTSRCRDNLE